MGAFQRHDAVLAVDTLVELKGEERYLVEIIGMVCKAELEKLKQAGLERDYDEKGLSRICILCKVENPSAA